MGQLKKQIKIKPFYNTDELARLFGVHKRTIYIWRQKYGLIASKIGRSIFFKADDIIDFVDRHREKSSIDDVVDEMLSEVEKTEDQKKDAPSGQYKRNGAKKKYKI